MKRTGKRLIWAAVGALLLLIILGFGVVPGIVARSMNVTLDGASGTVSAEASALHQTLLVADLHSDALLWDRDLLKRGTWGHTDVPRLVEGRIAVQSFTTVTKTPKAMNIEANAGDTDNITLLAVMQLWPRSTWSSLLARALHQADKLHATEARSEGRLTILKTGDDLEAYLGRRSTNDDITAGFLGIEGTHALEGDLANVDRLFDAGFRMFGLTHFFDNEVGGSAHGVDKDGLSDLGYDVIRRMEALGILVDLAHASPALIDDVLGIATRPIVVSHSGVKGTCDNRRNLDDERLAAIAATGGVIGIGLWETAVCGVTPADWARAVRYTADLVGVDYVGLGSDWDGAVAAMVDASQTVHLTQALLDADFEDEEIRKVMGGNVIRVLGEVLP